MLALAGGAPMLCTCRAPPIGRCSAASAGAKLLLPAPRSLGEAAPRAAGGAVQAAPRLEPPGYAAERPAGPANPVTSNGADSGGGGGRGGGDNESGGGGGGGETPAAVKMLRALDKKLRQVRPSCAWLHAVLGVQQESLMTELGTGCHCM